MFSSVAILLKKFRDKTAQIDLLLSLLGVFSDFAYDHEEYGLNLDNMYGE